MIRYHHEKHNLTPGATAEAKAPFACGWLYRLTLSSTVAAKWVVRLNDRDVLTYFTVGWDTYDSKEPSFIWTPFEPLMWLASHMVVQATNLANSGVADFYISMEWSSKNPEHWRPQLGGKA